MSQAIVQTLLDEAAAEGALSQASLGILGTLNAGFANGLGGFGVQDIGSVDDAFVGILVLDDSGSIQTAMADPATAHLPPHRQRKISAEPAIREGHNLFLRELRSTGAADSMLIHTMLLCTTKPVNDFVLLEEAVELDDKNFKAEGGSTPLYEKIAEAIGLGVAKAQSLGGARLAIIVLTDGINNAGGVSAVDCRVLVTEQVQNKDHMIMGIVLGSSEHEAEFCAQTFRDIGLPDKMIKKVGEVTRESILEVFRTASKASKATSQGSKVDNLGSFS